MSTYLPELIRIMNLIGISQILFYTSVVIWLVPAFRQFHSKLFVFFLILALMDPISIAYLYILNKVIPVEFYLFANYVLLISLIDKDAIRRNLFFIVISFIIILFLITFANFSINQNFIILVSIQFLMLAIILKRFIVNYAFEKSVNLFYLLLCFYFLTNITKFFNVLTGFADATAFFIITSIAQIIFGLFFSIFREDNPKIIL